MVNEREMMTLESVENKEFFEKLNKVYEEVEGTSEFGSRTEFYDEDGVLILAVEEQGEQTVFSFGLEDEYIMPRESVPIPA